MMDPDGPLTLDFVRAFIEEYQATLLDRQIAKTALGPDTSTGTFKIADYMDMDVVG